jgi:hypothetical protein
MHDKLICNLADLLKSNAFLHDSLGCNGESRQADIHRPSEALSAARQCHPSSCSVQTHGLVQQAERLCTKAKAVCLRGWHDPSSIAAARLRPRRL